MGLRSDLEQIEVHNRAGVQRAPQNTRTGSISDLLDRAQREKIERATENTRDRDDDRSR